MVLDVLPRQCFASVQTPPNTPPPRHLAQNQAISRGITKAGVGVEQLNLELCTPQEVEAALARARGFVIGSPTLGGHMPTQVQTTVGTILAAPDAVNLPTGVFGSFGWSGEAVDMLEQKFKVCVLYV